eukprot:363243-Chlamydomonas_euryale.AAC.13
MIAAFTSSDPSLHSAVAPARERELRTLGAALHLCDLWGAARARAGFANALWHTLGRRERVAPQGRRQRRREASTVSSNWR